MTKRNRQFTVMLSKDEEVLLKCNSKQLGLSESAYFRFLLKFSFELNKIIEERLKGDLNGE